jgi:hypothetical protein
LRYAVLVSMVIHKLRSSRSHISAGDLTGAEYPRQVMAMPAQKDTGLSVSPTRVEVGNHTSGLIQNVHIAIDPDAASREHEDRLYWSEGVEGRVGYSRAGGMSTERVILSTLNCPIERMQLLLEALRWQVQPIGELFGAVGLKDLCGLLPEAFQVGISDSGERTQVQLVMAIPAISGPN